MEVALLGGTGDIGEGLALRWARDTDHTVHVGSRKPEKARDRADDYREALTERGFEVDIKGSGNDTATEESDVVVVSVPPEYVKSTVESVAGALDSGDVLVSPAVSMDRDGDGFHYTAPASGSVAEEIAAVAPDDVPVVGAFQNLAAGALSDLDNDLDYDVIVTGDDEEATTLVAELAQEIEGIRALAAGSLANSAEVESITPLLINLAMNNDGMHDLGVKFQ